MEIKKRKSTYTLGEKVKFYIALKLNKNPEYCWMNLVLWVLGYRSFWSLFFKNHPENDYKDQSCREDNIYCPYAYCGKCEETGRFYNK